MYTIVFVISVNIVINVFDDTVNSGSDFLKPVIERKSLSQGAINRLIQILPRQLITAELIYEFLFLTVRIFAGW